MTDRRWTDEDAARAAAEARKAQGLPPTVQDPVALERIATLLDVGGDDG